MFKQMRTWWTAGIAAALTAGLAAAEEPAIEAAAEVAAEARDDVAVAVERVAEEDRPRIEVCFVLDTTGSMGRLIEGAKRKIWSIANAIATDTPAPRVKFALIGYRDRGDSYVTDVHDLTEDLDAIHAALQKYKADGGGDTPESVNQALHEAVTKVTWSKQDEDVLRVIFLVGDAPPHMDYDDDVKFPETCKLAVERGLIINTIQCGDIGGTKEIWQKIAHLSEGSFLAMPHYDSAVAIKTPYDKELAELNRELNGTALDYGEVQAQEAPAEKLESAVAAEDAEDEAKVADRAAYLSKSGRVDPKAPATTAGAALFSDDGSADAYNLLDSLGDKEVDITKLEKKYLPEALRKLSDDDLKAHIEKQRAEQVKIQNQMKELTAKRDAFIVKERARLAAEGMADSFDEEVSKVVKEQAERKDK